MDYLSMKQNLLKGWHTWNVRSVLSHVHMPDGLALNIAFKEFRSGHYLKETLIGRFPTHFSQTPAETAYPGCLSGQQNLEHQQQRCPLLGQQ